MSISLLSTPVTLMLLILNSIVSIVALYTDPSLLHRLGFRPVRIRKNREWYRFITAGFLHVALWHLAFNLITLFYFGPILELWLGPGKFFLVYMGSVLAAHAATYVAHRSNETYNAVGASGGISGVLFGYCLYEPFSLIYFFGVLPLPAIAFAIIFVVGSVWAIKGKHMGGISHEAHLGGALGGVALTIILEPRVITVFLRHLGL